MKLSPNLQKLNAKINSLSNQVSLAKGVKDRIVVQTNNLKTKIDADVLDAKNKKDAYLLLLGFVAHRRESAIKSIENTGTHALRAIYEDDRSLVFLKNEEKKNSAAFKMEVGIESNLESTRIITGLKDERGGGVCESSSFALRFAALEWLKYSGPMLLDESFRSMSSDEKISNVAKFMRRYIDSTDRQIFFATHMHDVFADYADHIIFVNQNDGVSQVSTQNETD